jgi:hypothetical protein
MLNKSFSAKLQKSHKGENAKDWVRNGGKCFRIRVASLVSPPDRRKHLVGHLRNVSTRSLVIIIFTSLHGDRFRRPANPIAA